LKEIISSFKTLKVEGKESSSKIWKGGLGRKIFCASTQYKCTRKV